jgi:para-nitrobenzyl esterase
MPKARAEGIGLQVAAALKAPGGSGQLAYMRNLPAEQVVAASNALLPTDLGSDTGLLTNVDGWVLPESPARVFAQGRETPVPLIIGNNSREITPDLTLDALRGQITAKYGPLAPRALEAYGLAGGGVGHEDPLLGGPGAQWMTDTVQRCGAVLEAGWHSAAGHPTFEYQFERALPGREALGSTHGAEVAFVFGNLNGAAFTPADREASDLIQQYWTRFAATGDPNGPGLPAWPKADSGRYMAFSAKGPAAGRDLQPGPCGVFREWALRRFPR